jgi:diguanylate cyclase (GGDEF)-like protein
MGHFIVLLLRRCELIKQLEQLSFYDQLSGLGNRHAMDRFISRMQPKKSIGIVYCDVTGLKRVNDQQGHKAGDMLLVGASECLRGAFAGYDMFRIGGDEFLVLCTGITEEQLIHRIERLKNDATEHAVVIAVGYVWRPDGTENMDRLLAEADRKMYEDKRQYYMENGRMI